ncbi:MAG: hypothetical protein LBV72_07010 [Tannerella sp.]|jgi:hypothetical protein|nr:hypothetical protein [Tannerella sp.]
MDKKIIECLERLKDSKIVKSEFYHIDLTTLCDVIEFLSADAGHVLDLIQNSGSIDSFNHLLEDLQRQFSVIWTLCGKMRDELSNDDFYCLGELFYNYKQESK